MGVRLVRAAVAAVFLCLGLALVAWWVDGTARAGETVAIKPAAAAESPSPELMRALMAWAAPRLELPVPTVMPRIVIKSHCELQAMATQTDHCPEPGSGHLALYGNNVLWLRDDWRGDNIRDVSILLHELVHHMQHQAGVPKTPCQAEAWEKPAYEAQFAFLEAAGVDPHKTIGINGLMLIFVTNCLDRHGGG